MLKIYRIKAFRKRNNRFVFNTYQDGRQHLVKFIKDFKHLSSPQ